MAYEWYRWELFAVTQLVCMLFAVIIPGPVVETKALMM